MADRLIRLQQNDAMASKATVDPLIQLPYLTELATAYLHGAVPRNPLVSPIHADLRGLPPMLIQVGSAETLLSASIQLAARAGKADIRVTLQIWPEMIHAWHLFHPQFAAGRDRGCGQVCPRRVMSASIAQRSSTVCNDGRGT